MELELHSDRKQIAVVSQQSILFTGTLRENITYGSESISEEQLWNVIHAANLEEVVQKLVKGRTTLIVAHRLSTIRNADRIVVLKRINYGIIEFVPSTIMLCPE